MIGFAFLIGRIPPWGIVVLGFSALLFNWQILPAFGKNLYRETDRAKGFSIGILAYPASVTILALLFYGQQIFLAIGWGIMAFGDGFGGWVGEHQGGKPIAWNPRKTWTGTLVFFVAGFFLTLMLVMALPESVYQEASVSTWLLIIFGATLAGAVVETLPGLVDDNFSVPLAGAGVAYLCYHMSLMPVPTLPGHLWGAVLIIGVFMGLSVWARKIDLPGSIAGGCLTFALFLGDQVRGMALIFVFFVLGSLASLYKRQDKRRLGVAQENQGIRSVRHALSNAGVAGICGFCAWWFPGQAPVFQLMMASAFAAALGDTLSSELGNVWGTRYYHILSLKSRARGEDGVVSWEGTLAGIAGSGLVAAIYGFSHHAGGLAAGVLLAGIAGNLMDSLLGGSLQRAGYLNNDTVNLLNTLFAAGVGYGAFLLA